MRRSHDRQGAEIDAGRVLPVDRDLSFAGRAPLLQRREVHERETDGALDLVDVGPGEKDDGAGGVDAPNRPVEAVRRGIGEEAERLLLSPVAGAGARRGAAIGHGVAPPSLAAEPAMPY